MHFQALRRRLRASDRALRASDRHRSPPTRCTRRKSVGRMKRTTSLPPVLSPSSALQARQRVSPSRGGKQASVRHDKIELRFLSIVGGKPAVKEFYGLLKRGRHCVDTNGLSRPPAAARNWPSQNRKTCFAVGVTADHLPQIVRNRVEQQPLASRKILQRAIMDKYPAAMNEWVRVHQSRATHASLPNMGHERRRGDRLGQLIKLAVLNAACTDFEMCGSPSSSNEASPQPSTCDSPRASHRL